MATFTRSSHELPGALGPILVDVRAADRQRPQPAVLVMHGFKGFKDYAFVPPIAERLARAGFTAVTFSVSGSGVDQRGDFTFFDRFARNTYTRELGDIASVLAALDRGDLGVPPPSTVGIVGHSRGGGVALCVAGETPRIDAVVTWAAMSTVRRYTDAQVELWRRMGTMNVVNSRTGQSLPMNYEIVEDVLANLDRFDILAAAAALARPWLLLHGDADETIPVTEARALAAVSCDPRFESRYIDGAGHTFGAVHPWAGPTAATEELFDATVRFLSRYLS
ncbi:MAG TPA: alpha/beta fold hydrolase [Gemmatimonadales bacterium]|jgi:dienelactone hydrolase